MGAAPSLRRKLVVVCALIGLCLGVIASRALWEGKSALAKGNDAAAQGDGDGAIRWWRRAARWYVPGAGHVDSAYAKLAGLAEEAEARGDTTLALAGWRATRRSVLATRSFFTPHGDRLQKANERIAVLMAAQETSAADSPGSLDERRAFHKALLTREVGPSVGWSLLALLGLLLWVGGALYFALRGLGADDRLHAPAARLSVALIAVGLVIWMLGLYNA